MQACAFDSFLSQITQLSRRQGMHVLAVLKAGVDEHRTAAVLLSSTRPRPRPTSDVARIARAPACTGTAQRMACSGSVAARAGAPISALILQKPFSGPLSGSSTVNGHSALTEHSVTQSPQQTLAAGGARV